MRLVEGQNHGVAADYYALGVIVYECMVRDCRFGGNLRAGGQAAVLGEEQARNPRADPGEASADKGERGAFGVVVGVSRLREPGKGGNVR